MSVRHRWISGSSHCAPCARQRRRLLMAESLSTNSGTCSGNVSMGWHRSTLQPSAVPETRAPAPISLTGRPDAERLTLSWHDSCPKVPRDLRSLPVRRERPREIHPAGHGPDRHSAVRRPRRPARQARTALPPTPGSACAGRGSPPPPAPRRSAARSAVPVEISLRARRRTVLGENSISNLTCVSRPLMISVHIRPARGSRRVRADHAARAGRFGDRIAAWDAERMAESSMPRAS
jgi:hypothetical protein